MIDVTNASLAEEKKVRFDSLMGLMPPCQKRRTAMTIILMSDRMAATGGSAQTWRRGVQSSRTRGVQSSRTRGVQSFRRRRRVQSFTRTKIMSRMATQFFWRFKSFRVPS